MLFQMSESTIVMKIADQMKTKNKKGLGNLKLKSTNMQVYKIMK